MNEELPEPTRRPKKSPFLQQNLPAWQPVFSSKNAAILFLTMGLVFIPIGVVLLVTSNSVVEYVFEYTNCKNAQSQSCSQATTTPCTCSLNLKIDSDIPGPAYLYYELTNFYQNHRRYARSKNDAQLLGTVQSYESLSSCAPYQSLDVGGTPHAILPCGLIANSLFNDTFRLSYMAPDGTNQSVNMLSNGIAWKSDIQRKFGALYADAKANTVKPPNWPKPIDQRTVNPFKSDEELIVWMRVAALPNFRKLHRRIEDGIAAGNYVMEVDYAFPVTSFGGRKYFVLGNVSWLGGKNNSLGILFIVTGSLHVLIGILFLAVHIYAARSPERAEQIYSSPLLLRFTNRNVASPG